MFGLEILRSWIPEIYLFPISIIPIVFFSLLTAKFSSDLKIKSGDIKGSLNVELGTDYKEKVVLNSVNLRMPAENIQNFANTMGADIGGNISTSNLSLEIERTKIKTVSGTVRLPD